MKSDEIEKKSRLNEPPRASASVDEARREEMKRLAMMTPRERAVLALTLGRRYASWTARVSTRTEDGE